ncbi:uncharacterized protein LOC112503817 [Cynara cardunculus var. scolymus]|uniref:uncharacterized protein LOC112503817 n=1 Tax=Cynara cardunculus var. scolymus TaxID=59895 RepID=UPI000D62E725|nr:uncharacterized protein LOC112503817 [Cynara cardunculus var. scolymus]
MAVNNITFIQDLDIQKDDFTVKVRIVRLWKQPVFKNPNEIYFFEMILMDKHGTKIQANVPQKRVPKFRNLIQEGATIFVKNPTIARHASKYMLTDNTNKLSLYYKTSLSNCRDFKGSIFGFSFVKFANLISKSILEHTAVDVIGDVIACETMVTFPGNNGKAKRRMQVEMQDLEGIKMQVTLWDAFTQELNDYVSTNKDNEIVILVIQFAMVKIYRDFLDGTSRANIVEISETVEAKSLIILGTVKAFRKDVPWFYMGCTRCNRKVRPMYTITDKDDGSGMKEESESFDCMTDRRRGKMTGVLTKFRISLRVQDDTGIVSLTLFDREANKVLNQTATELFEKSGDLDMFPDDLDVLLDRRFAIKIDITVTILKTPVSFMPAESESVNLHSTDFSSQDQLKNATPSDVDKSTADSPESEEKLFDRRLGKGFDRKRLFESWSDADQEGK